MPEQLLNLSTHQVQRLRQDGHCTWTCDGLPAQAIPYETSTQLLVRESVAKPRTEDESWHYRADGQQAGRFYLPNYLAPRASCRLRVEVVGSWHEHTDAGQWSYSLTLQLRHDASVLSA